MSGTRIKCGICSVQFTDHQLMLEHYRTQHGNNTAADKPIQCEWCDEKLPTLGLAIAHKHKNHPSVAHFTCTSCGSQFPFRFSLEEHMKIVHRTGVSQEPLEEQPKFPCLICFETFSRFDALGLHMKYSCSMKPPQQPIDPLKKRSLPIYLPPASSKVMTDENNQQVSVYYCHLCGVECSPKSMLQDHLYNSHTMQQLQNIPLSFFKCQRCQAPFVSLKLYNHHQKCHKSEQLIPTTVVKSSGYVPKNIYEYDTIEIPDESSDEDSPVEIPARNKDNGQEKNNTKKRVKSK